MRSSLKLVALSACLAVTLSSPAFADPPPAAPPGAATPGGPPPPPPPVDPAKAAAQRLADQVKHGNEACAQGDMDEGLATLRAAWVQHEDVELAVALAGCEVKAGDYPAAADHLAFALRNRDDPEQRKALEASFLSVRARVGAVKVTVNVDGADVFVGERFVGTTPLPGEVYVPAGKSLISAKKPGYGELDGRVDVPAQGTTTLALDLAGEGAASASQRFAPSRSRTPAIVLGAIGLTVVGVGAALYAVGASKGDAGNALLSELQTVSSEPCLTSTPGCQTLKSLRSSHDSFVNAGTGVLVGGGAILGATLIYALWANATPAPIVGSMRSVHVAPSVGKSAGSLVLEGSF